MKFNARTIQILRNFASINEGMIFKPGQVIKTLSPTKSVMAKAVLENEIPQSFAIFDIPQFLSAVSMFEDPELTVNDTHMEIGSGKEKLKFTFSAPNLIHSPSDKEINLQEVDVEFDLKSDVLARTMKALSIIDAPCIAVTGDGQNVYLEAMDPDISTKSTYRVPVSETDKEFRYVFKAENLKLLQDDYRVRISGKGISHFKSADVEYWIAFLA
jgi:hypothetical protein